MISIMNMERTDEEDISITWFRQGLPEAFKAFFSCTIPNFSPLHSCFCAMLPPPTSYRWTPFSFAGSAVRILPTTKRSRLSSI
ncbi:hypothetical protein ACQ86N_14710 [Puia sp. P3]|uniref:hypothetical protein n=1 Tax=Puia sp. P3 TaxID=3423952 RepID=UPI003D66E819